jgi:hypothetical protein
MRIRRSCICLSLKPLLSKRRLACISDMSTSQRRGYRAAIDKQIVSSVVPYASHSRFVKHRPHAADAEERLRSMVLGSATPKTQDQMLSSSNSRRSRHTLRVFTYRGIERINKADVFLHTYMCSIDHEFIFNMLYTGCNLTN